MQEAIIKTDYPGLIRLMYPDLRFERQVPFRDNFLLLRDISYNESNKLDRFKNYIIVSNTYYREEWDEQRIVDEIKKLNKSRRKPKLDENASAEEFEHNAKVFLVTGYWPKEVEGESIFNFFKKMDSVYRVEEYFKLRQTYPAKMILYSLITFSVKAMELDASDVSGAYLRLLSSKQRIVTKNFRRALNNYSKYDLDVDEDIKTLRFVYDLGDV